MRELKRLPFRMQFPDRFKDDIPAYFEAFGEIHNFQIPNLFDKDIIMVCDGFGLMEREVKQGINAAEFGISDSDLHIFARCCDLPERQPAETRIIVDGRIFIVDEWVEDEGIAEITASVSTRY